MSQDWLTPAIGVYASNVSALEASRPGSVVKWAALPLPGGRFWRTADLRIDCSVDLPVHAPITLSRLSVVTAV